MELFCPECRGRLKLLDSQTAHCPIHSGHFQVLYARGATLDPPKPETPVAMPAGVHCVQHPHLAATVQCVLCGAYMCATCDFVTADGQHVCPACVISSREELSPRRRRALGWSYACAGGATLLMAVLLSGAMASLVETEEGQMLVGVLFLLVVGGPSIAGLSLAVAARSRQARNPLALWIALAWNGALLGIFLLLCLIGSLS